MGNTLEVTIQRRVDGSWPVVVVDHRVGTLLPVRSEGRLQLASEPMDAARRSYGTTLGQALFRDAVRDAFVRARNEGPDGVRVLVFVEAEELKSWRWEWLCAPVDGDVWDFLSLDQRALFSLYLPSLTDRAYPPIGRHDLRALVVVANPTDPKYSRLASFDGKENVGRLQSVFGDQLPATILARVPAAAGVPTLDEVVRQLTAGSGEGPYTILHVVCHGWVNPEKETILYLEQPSADPASGRGLAQPVKGSDLIERLRRIGRLPYLIFLSTCESSAPEAEQRMGGLAQRLVRELGIPAVIGMTERVTIATAHALADEFYRRLLAQARVGEVDRALVQAYAGLAARPDVNVPALYSRLGAQPLFSLALDRPLTPAESRSGLQQLDELLVDRAPVLRTRLAEKAQKLEPLLGTDPDALAAPARQEGEKALTEINELCQEAVEINFNALAQGEQPPAYDSRQPFRGLSPFRAEDREFFFGREALVQKLEQKLNRDNFLPVLGPSGSGKSSLVLAGLVPKLKEQVAGLQVMDDLTPGSAPMDQLKIRQAKLSSGPVLYVVDQFEELFTLCKDEKQRQDFIDELLRLADSNRVVLTMRADFWGECATYPALKERMQARQELIAPMTTSELRGAMEQQAAKVGLRFEADLSNTMLDEVAGEPGAMPLLQHALLELWKRRHGRWMRAEEYRTIGGVKKAIAETADQVYNQLGEEDRQLLKPAPPADRPTPTQDRMRDVFVRLTQIDENVGRSEERRDTRRRLSVSDLVPAGSKAEETKALLKKLADAALVVTSRNEVTGQDEAEVAHEALIRHWGKLRTWLDEDLTTLKLRDSITEAAKEWEKARDDEGLLVHRSSRLESMDLFLRRTRSQLTDIEVTYIEACRLRQTNERLREQRTSKTLRRRAALLAILLFASLVMSVAAITFWQRERRSRIETDRQLTENIKNNLLMQVLGGPPIYGVDALHALIFEHGETIDSLRKRAAHAAIMAGPVSKASREASISSSFEQALYQILDEGPRGTPPVMLSDDIRNTNRDRDQPVRTSRVNAVLEIIRQSFADILKAKDYGLYGAMLAAVGTAGAPIYENSADARKLESIMIRDLRQLNAAPVAAGALEEVDLDNPADLHSKPQQYLQQFTLRSRNKFLILRHPVGAVELSVFFGGRGSPNSRDMPATGVNWYTAYAYAVAAGGRLPSADEWHNAFLRGKITLAKYRVNQGLPSEHFTTVDSEWCDDRIIDKYPTLFNRGYYEPDRFVCATRDVKFPLGTDRNRLAPRHDHALIGFRFVIPIPKRP